MPQIEHNRPGGSFAKGELGGVHLNGRYEVTFELEDVELKNWLKSYIDTKPQEALELLAEMLPLAVEARKG